MESKVKDDFRNMTSIIMIQLYKSNKHAQVKVNEGMKMRSNNTLNALLSEFGQLHVHNTFRRVRQKYDVAFNLTLD